MPLKIESISTNPENTRIHENYGQLTFSEHRVLRQRAARFAYGRELTPEELASLETKQGQGFTRHETLVHSVFTVANSRYETFGSTIQHLQRSAIIASFTDHPAEVKVIYISREQITSDQLPTIIETRP